MDTNVKTSRRGTQASTPTVERRVVQTGATSRIATPVSPRRHFTWLAGAAAGAFLVPFILADQLGLQRDIYYAVCLFVAWARDTHQPLRAMFARRWRLAVGLGVVFAAISAFIAIGAENSSPHPGGIEFVAVLFWRGVVYGAADGLLLSAFPILLVFAALRNSTVRRRAGGLVAVGAVAMVASLAMTAVYHAGYSDFRSDKLRKPMTGDLIWSVPTLATLNPIGAPIAHVGLHVGAVVHNSDTDLFLPPH
jgi:xanthine/uracil permease